MVYTYKITCLTTNKIYFGYTTTTLQRRFTRHCHERRTTVIRNSIKKYGKEQHIIELVQEHNTEQEAKNCEIYLITMHQTNMRKYPNGIGLNMTDGGEGCKGYKFTAEHKQYLKQHSQAWYSGSHNKPVFQFSQDGTFIQEHKSAKFAAKSVGAHGADISKCCHRIIRTVKGYCFSYDKNNPNIRQKYPKNSPLKKAITVITPQKTIIQCNSISETSRTIQCAHNNIVKAIKTQKPIKGFLVSWSTQEHLLEPHCLHTEQPS